MRDFQILTDSLCDLPSSWLNAHDYITVVDTPITISGPEHNMTVHHLTADDFEQIEYYVKKKGCRAMTSQPQAFDPYEENPESVETLTRKYVRMGKDVIYVTMSSFLSGTYGMISVCYSELSEWAAEQGRKIACVDSQCMSTGLGLLIMELAQAIERNTISNIKDIENFVVKNRGYIGHFFTWAKLDYIKLSGRVSATKAFVGDLLGIRLMCSAQYNSDGERKLEHINPRARLRGIGRFAEALGRYAETHILDPTGPIIVAHGNVPHDAEIVVSKLRKYLPNATYLTGPEWRCGAGIQTHGGKSSLHVNFHTKEIGRLEKTTKEMEQIIRGLSKH